MNDISIHTASARDGRAPQIPDWAWSPDNTPFFRNYLADREAIDAVLAYPMGDFVEFFFDDAVIVSELLDVNLTHRGTVDGRPVPLCGFPKHGCVGMSLSDALHRIAEAGYRVAIGIETGKLTADGCMSRMVYRWYPFPMSADEPGPAVCEMRRGVAC